LNVLVPQVSLQRPGILAVVRQLVAAGVAQHVRMALETEPSSFADARTPSERRWSVRPIHYLLAAKAALAKERPSIGTMTCGQARHNLTEPHSLTAFGTPHNRDSGIGRLARNKYTYSLIVEAPYAFAQFIASR
jgi:hypothetical protein